MDEIDPSDYSWHGVDVACEGGDVGGDIQASVSYTRRFVRRFDAGSFVVRDVIGDFAPFGVMRQSTYRCADLTRPSESAIGSDHMHYVPLTEASAYRNKGDAEKRAREEAENMTTESFP